MSRVVYFEIPADDPERAAKFYEDVFGWTVKKWNGPYDYWLIDSGSEDEPGIPGAIMMRERSKTVRDTIPVDNYDDSAEKIEMEGGKMLTQKMEIPVGGFRGTFQDTEGNIFDIIGG